MINEPLKKPFAIYLDLECILKKLQSIQNNPEKSYTEKKARHEPSAWALYTRCSFDEKENKLNYYRGKDCTEELCKQLKENAMEINNREKKKKWYHKAMKKIIFIMNKKYVIYAKKRFV